jgi:hypothetical protein
MEGSISTDELFRRAVQIIDAGDKAAMQQLLDQHPQLVHERLTAPGAWLRDKIGGALDGFFKDPYLLWFVSEDAIINKRLPANITGITAVIIQKAKQEKVSSLQEQLDYTLRLVCWSGVAKEYNVQLPLIDLLIAEGATPSNPNEPLVNGNIDAARRLVEHGAPLTFAAAICFEQVEDIARLAASADENNRLEALVLAALNGNARAIRLMTSLGGFNINSPCRDIYSHATPLHHAVCSGSLDAVKAMVEGGADTTIKDTAWAGTPLGWAEHYIHETENKGEYKEIAEYLKTLPASK